MVGWWSGPHSTGGGVAWTGRVLGREGAGAGSTRCAASIPPPR